MLKLVSIGLSGGRGSNGRNGRGRGRSADIANKLPALDQTWLWEGFDGPLVLDEG